MAQVYSFVDENGVTRLLAEIHPDPQPTSGTLVPVADAAGVVVDTTTYDDTLRGSGKLTTLVFPGLGTPQGALAMALAGDAFPRWLFSSDTKQSGLCMCDGTFDAILGASVVYNAATFGFTFNCAIDVNAAIANTQPPTIEQVSPVFLITSGALPTLQLVTTTGAQISTTRDVETVTPCTFNPGAATTATVTVAISPDNMTYSTLGIETVTAGVALDGTTRLIKARVPAGWYLKLTVNAQASLGLTSYY